MPPHSIYHSYTRQSWILLLTTLLVVPVFSWLNNILTQDIPLSVPMVYKLLGQLTGIIGVQLFAFSLILSGRLKSIEKLFGGLDRLYVIHHRVGVIAFSFLAFHPIILALRFAQNSIEDAANFLSPFNASGPVIFGMTSLVTMMLLILLTFYGAIFNYPSLKTAHKFLGVAFFLGFFHVLFIPSSLSTDIVLKTSLLVTSGLGISIYFYRSILDSFLVPRFTYKVTSIQNLPGGVTEITLSAVSKKLYHLPGQFGILSFPHSDLIPKEEHPFTISSSGNSDTIRFSIKALGDYTKIVSSLTVGETALIEGPFGEFSYGYGKDKQVWVAGGIGITPFVSMAEYMMTLETLPYTIDLFYSVRTETEGPYKKLFEALAKKHKTFTFHFIPSDTGGFITGEVLLKETGNLHARDIFICGPPPLMSALTNQLLELNVPKKRIRTERFALLK